MSAHLIVVATVYFRPADGGQPTAREARWSRPLEGAEAPYVRTLQATTAWQALDTGWIEQSGFLVVTNDEGPARLVQPTEEERAAVAARILEIATHDGETAAWLVQPGEALFCHPADARRLRLRCQAGTARCTVALYPA
jgi:hypothetical protein